jgi:hypothetical protein
VNRLASFVLLLGCSLAGTAGNAASTNQVHRCSTDQLAYALPQRSAPSQTWAVGFAVFNTGRTSGRLMLPLSLALGHRSQEPLRVLPRESRLTLIAPVLRPLAQAGVTWTYTNYCGGHESSERPIVYTVRVSGVELRGRAGTAPCRSQRLPVRLSVLFACPGAKGPAIAAILPRPLPLCPR